MSNVDKLVLDYLNDGPYELMHSLGHYDETGIGVAELRDVFLEMMSELVEQSKEVSE